jgi:hypothetical protein
MEAKSSEVMHFTYYIWYLGARHETARARYAPLVRELADDLLSVLLRLVLPDFSCVAMHTTMSWQQ